MGNKPVRFHPEAEREYLAALNWYNDRSPTAAANFENVIGKAVTAVGRSPARWPIYFQAFRKYTLRQFPFSIIYQELSLEIVIFAVAHGRRRPRYWSARD
jgi:plasmid stabilization system protein ParE